MKLPRRLSLFHGVVWFLWASTCIVLVTFSCKCEYLVLTGTRYVQPDMMSGFILVLVGACVFLTCVVAGALAEFALRTRKDHDRREE